MKLVHTFPLYFPKIHSNIILPLLSQTKLCMFFSSHSCKLHALPNSFSLTSTAITVVPIYECVEFYPSRKLKEKFTGTNIHACEASFLTDFVTAFVNTQGFPLNFSSLTLPLSWQHSTSLKNVVLCGTGELGYISWNFPWMCTYNKDEK
jgi:hypothetical protein